jgi:hypothetical protein
MSTIPLKNKTPWPTKEVMIQIYQLNLWGGKEYEFYSGDGSHDITIIEPYQEVVIRFLQSFDEPLIVCDLGCGDFNVGKKFVSFTKKYIGVDIVPDLIERNKNRFQAENLSFQCLDLATDELPKGDCAIIRQVLQHLSNHEIQKILQKLSAYQYVILTEHLPSGDFIPNKDKIASQGIRLKQQSGINLIESPFYWDVLSSKELLSIELAPGKGKIITTLYNVF